MIQRLQMLYWTFMHKLHTTTWCFQSVQTWAEKQGLAKSMCCFWLSNSFSWCTLAPSTGTPSQPLLEGATKGPLQPRQAAVAQWHGWEEESCFSPISPLRTTTSHFPATGTPSNSTQTHAEEAWKAYFQWSDRCLCQLHRKDFMLYIHLPGDGTSYLLCQEHSYILSLDYWNASILVNWRLQNSTIYEEENLYCLK